MVRQTFVGTVIGTAMAKTAKVRVERLVFSDRIHKYINRHKNFLAHDEQAKCSVGDIVRIEACRPLSPRKSFTVHEIIKPGEVFVDANGDKQVKLPDGLIKDYSKFPPRKSDGKRR
ncbi:hypothetical protein RI367_007191 [Sorochytrium milnesiophthora]